MNREVASHARPGRDSTNTSPSSLDIRGGVPVTDRKLSPDDSPSSNCELKRGDRFSRSDLEDFKQEPLKDMPDWPKVTSKESVGSVSSFLDSALSTVSDGYLSESFRDSLAPRYETQFASLPSSSVMLPSHVMALKDTSDTPAPARNESVDSVSSFVDSALSTVSDGHHSFSDSLKESSPEIAFQALRSASCDNLLNMGRFSAPVDRSPARPRRLSEPVLPVQFDFDFDVPMLRRSYNTENVFRSEGTSTPRASNIEEFQIRDLEVEGMILRCLSIEDDSDSHSELTPSDGEGKKTSAAKDRMAALIRSRDGSPKPGQKDASPQRPRRRRRRKDQKEPDPDSTPSPPDEAMSPTTARGRFPREWRDERRAHKAELRWSVTSAPRWRAHSSDEILQTPFRRRRDFRDVASEADTVSAKSSGVLVVKKRGALMAEEPFVSPPLKAGGSDTTKPTPSTARPTPSPSETATKATLRENFHSLDCPPPL